jgi:endonuclease G, mitochondrial
VPSHTWKVIVVLPEGTNDVSRVTTATRVIAVIIPNRQDISTSWESYRTTVDNIEAIRSYNLLSNVPSSIQSVIESRVDAGPTI